MTALFAFLWLVALVTFVGTRFSSISVLIISSLIYSFPVFWSTSTPTEPAIVWCVVLTIAILSQVYLECQGSRHDRDLDFLNGKGRFINFVFNGFLLILFITVVVRSGGIAVFFEGKYGAVAGGSVFLYYVWNSLLLLTSVFNLVSKQIFSPFNVFCLFQMLLIFIGGDRTLPVLYALSATLIYLRGIRPLALLTVSRAFVFLLFIALAPVLAVSKSIYTLLPDYGNALAVFSIVFGPEFWMLASKDFEPTHIHRILIYATSGPVDYDIFDLLLGIFSFIPGSSLFGIEPHAFSLAVKSRYFPTWSDTAGIGAHFWAQAWVVGGILGVIIAGAGVVWILIFLERVLCKKSPTIRVHAVVQVVLIGFYLQRNSMEQILSFSGRYFVLFFLLVFGASILLNILPKRRFAK